MLAAFAEQGFFFFPWTNQDYIIASMAILGTTYRLFHMPKKYKSKDVVGVLCISAILTLGLYEMAIANDWKLRNFYLPFAVSIIISKDISDFLFKSKEGRSFVINTFISMVEGVLSKFGFEKKKEDKK